MGFVKYMVYNLDVEVNVVGDGFVFIIIIVDYGELVDYCMLVVGDELVVVY